MTLGAAAAVATGARGAAAAPEAAGPLRRGGTLKVIGLDPASFDVQAAPETDTQLVSSLVRRTLFKLAFGPAYGPSDFTLVPDLALDARASADARTYTIALRPDVRWEQRPPLGGRQVVAGDVKYTIERALRKLPDPGIVGPVEGVETEGRHIVRVHLAEPCAPFLHLLAQPWLGILAPEVEDRFGDLRGAASLLGCGPFVLERHEPGARAVFVRNLTYYRRGFPLLDRIDWIFLKDRATRLSLFREGQVDLPAHDARVTRAEAALLRDASPGGPVMAWDSLAVRSLAMRCDRPPFDDPRVRRACSLSLDRAAWVARDLGGDGYEGTGPVPEALREWSLPARELGAGGRYLEHDPAFARQLLAAAGFPSGLKIRCAYLPGWASEYGDEIDTLAASLRRVGVEMRAVTPAAGEPEETSWAVSPLFTDVGGYVQTLLRAGRRGNRSRVADAELERLLGAEQRPQPRSARTRALDAIQRRAAEQVYYVHTPYAKNVSAWAPWVKGYRPRNSLDRGAQLEGVWLARPSRG